MFSDENDGTLDTNRGEGQVIQFSGRNNLWGRVRSVRFRRDVSSNEQQRRTTISCGKRELYAVESPENWFEDFGGAELIQGRAIVKLDPVFAETVSTEVEYHVFLTPKGDCQGLYIARQSADSFEVRELQYGKQTIAFDYRVVAKRKGYERTRLAEVNGSRDTNNTETRIAEK